MTWWEAERAYQMLASIAAEAGTGHQFDDPEREALARHDYPTLLAHGAHPFLTLTLFITLFERDHHHPLGFQLGYAWVRMPT